MSILTIFRGLPASGKSSHAKKMVKENYADTILVNRDYLREMLHDSVWLGAETENTVVHIRNLLIRDGLKRGKHVISDDTNLNSKVVRDLIAIADHYGATVQIVDFFDVPVEECIRRDSLRTGRHQVGEKVIRNMYEKYLKNGKPKNPLAFPVKMGVDMLPYVPDNNLRSAVVFDIDGTLAKMNGRSPYDYTRVMEDLPHNDVLEMLFTFAHLNVKIIILSGREDSCREDTVAWLKKFGVSSEFYDMDLYMRAEGDKRADYIIKYELFDKHIRNQYRIKAWFDDRQQVVDAMRSIGIRVYQVAPGDF